VIDNSKKIVQVFGEEVLLSRKEYGILCLLVDNPGRVYSREEILDYVWCGESLVLGRTVDVHITRLRKKLGEIGQRIINRQGYGYCYQP
jgi:DNA-binding response OmpR family regulator